MTSYSLPGRGGPLAIVGGRFEYDNRIVFEEMKRLSNGKMAVFPTASGFPEEVGQDMVEDLRNYGFTAEIAPVSLENRETSPFDPEILKLVESLGSVYFTGGDQNRIIDTLRPNGQDTPLLQLIYQLHRKGGLVAGSSAGAAMMSRHIIRDGSSLEALIHGHVPEMDQPGLTTGEGLGFFPWGVVDQHFIRRGRLGRLIMAMKATGNTFGFGVDENTAMIVENGMMQVVGEYGVNVIDLRKASIHGDDFHNVLLSYLDDGDRYDLHRQKALPHPHKKRIRVTKASYRTRAPFHRNAFGSYALHDLMIRMVQGDPGHYSRDVALAYDRKTNTEVSVELLRIPRRTRALRTMVDNQQRYTAINFVMNLTHRNMPETRWQDVQKNHQLHLFNSSTLSPRSRLITLSNSPMDWSKESTEALLRCIEEPVGVIAAASGDAHYMGRDYVEWLYHQDIHAKNLGVSSRNIDRCNEDKELLERIAKKRTLIFTGGDQHRLVETLLHRGETTPVLKAIAHAYQQGATLITIGGASSAMCGQMIIEGDSYEALKYGASADAGNKGIVIEEGLGLFPCGIIDQRMLKRQRLGRLIVACAEQNIRYGFGLCEESGMVLGGSGRIVHAFGKHGMLVVDVDHRQFSLNNDIFNAQGVNLLFVQPGEAFDPDKGTLVNPRTPDAEMVDIEKMVKRLARSCGIRANKPPVADHWLKMDLQTHNERPFTLDIQSNRR